MADEDLRALAGRLIADEVLPATAAVLDGPAGMPAEAPAEDRVRGMLLGLAIGDALGHPTEALNPGERRASHGEIRDFLPNRQAGDRAVGLPSDDTQLAFWTLESLLEKGRLDPEDLSGRFASRQIVGIGQSVRNFVGNYRNRIEPWYMRAAPSAGNGALMRIAPVVLPHLRGAAADLWVEAAIASLVTHRDAASVAACVAYADLLCRVLKAPALPRQEAWPGLFLGPARAVSNGERYVPRGAFEDERRSFPDYVEHVLDTAVDEGWSVRQACDAWRSGAYLLETVPSVLYILMRHAGDPEEALVRAVNDTRDNDTVAALVGAAVGALHGEQALPARWRDNLLGRTQEADDGRVQKLIALAMARWGVPGAA